MDSTLRIGLAAELCNHLASDLETRAAWAASQAEEDQKQKSGESDLLTRLWVQRNVPRPRDDCAPLDASPEALRNALDVWLSGASGENRLKAVVALFDSGTGMLSKEACQWVNY